MARSDEVPDEYKDTAHTVPMDVWKKIRADAEKGAEAEGKDDDGPEAGDRT